MSQTSQMNIPLNSATGFFQVPYHQELANHGVSQEEFNNTLFRVSHKNQNSTKSSKASKCCNIINFSISTCCCIFFLFLLGFTLSMMGSAPSFSKSAVYSALTSKKVQTVALGGPQKKVDYLKRISDLESIKFVAFTTNPTKPQIENAFQKNDVVYFDLEVLDESSQISVCEQLKKDTKTTFFGGFKNKIKEVHHYRNCRKNMMILNFVDYVPVNAFISVIFGYFLLFACILGTPICCCLGFKLCNKGTSNGAGMESILMEETMKYHQKGVQFLFNSITNSIDVVFYNGPVPQFIPQQIPQQQQFRPQYVQQPQQQVFVPQQQQFVQPQYREVHQQNVQIQPQFSVQPTFTVQQQNQTENIYYSSKVEEVPEESQTQAFLYPKQQGIINGDKFE